MNIRRAIPLAVVVAVLLVAALGFRTWKRSQVVVVAPPVVTESCPIVAPPPLLEELSQAPLIINSPGVTVKFDGREANGLAAAGTHVMEASAPDARSARFEVRFEALQPVIIDARVNDGVVTVLLLGARCSSCAVAETELDLAFRTNAFGSMRDVSAALSTGDWLKAVQAIHAVPPSDRESAEAVRLIAVLNALAGRQTEAEALVENSDMKSSFTKRAALLNALAPRQLETAVARWNATTERFQRLTEALLDDAPDELTALTWTFDGFSTRFLQAHGTRDVIAGEIALQSASKALDDSIKELRALKPKDCAWQRRINATF